MIALIALFVQGLEFNMPTQSIVPIDDRSVGALGVLSPHDLRGRLVSDDGKMVYALRGNGIALARTEAHGLIETGFFVRKSDKTARLYTGGERYSEEQKGASREDWEDARIIALLRAEGDSLTLAFSSRSGTRYGVATALWTGVDSPPSKTLYEAPEGRSIDSGWPDLSSDQPFLSFNSRGDRKTLGYGQPNSTDLIPGRPGFQPIFFDTRRNRYLQFVYNESGFPFEYSLRPITGRAPEIKLPFQQGLDVVRFAFISGSHILASFQPHGDESVPPKGGTYLLDEIKNTWTRISPAGLEGQSANGLVLLMSDPNLRKSWIVTLK